MSACKDNPELWFSENPEDVELAKRLCEDCPLSRFEACRAEGWNHEFGVYGGLSPSDRARSDPDRAAAVVSAGRAVAERRDATLRLSRVADEISQETYDEALAVLHSMINPKTAGLTLRQSDMTDDQVSRVLGVHKHTVRNWGVQARKAVAADV